MPRSRSETLSCPTCVAPLVQIRVGEALTLRSCSNCDSRWWLRDDRPTDLDQVLATVGRGKGYRPVTSPEAAPTN